MARHFAIPSLWMLRMPQTIGLAPQLIYHTRDGDNSTLRLSLPFPIQTFDSIALGTYISVTCHDQVFAMSLEKLDQTIYDMCKLWETNPPLPGENDPVNSEIPTLIFSGRYDSVTPPAYAHQLATHLSHSYVVLVPNQGHAPSATEISDCPGQLISAFLKDPATLQTLPVLMKHRPSSSSFLMMPIRPWFLSLLGSSSIKSALSFPVDGVMQDTISITAMMHLVILPKIGIQRCVSFGSRMGGLAVYQFWGQPGPGPASYET